MIHQNSLRFYKDVAYDTYDGLVLNKTEGDRLASMHLGHLRDFLYYCSFSISTF